MSRAGQFLYFLKISDEVLHVPRAVLASAQLRRRGRKGKDRRLCACKGRELRQFKLFRQMKQNFQLFY